MESRPDVDAEALRASRRLRGLRRHLLCPSGTAGVDPWEVQSKHLVVNVSNRHVHVTEDDVQRLFGKGYKLQFLKGLVGLPPSVAKLAGYACKETVDVVNPSNGKRLERVRILGPPRSATQVELAYTDCRALGIEAPTRISGDTVRSAPCRLVAPSGNSIDVDEGVIRAWRHVHMSPHQAAWLGTKDGASVAIRIHSPMNSVLLLDVLVRVVSLPEPMMAVLKDHGVRSPVEVHIDTDEANACMIQDAVECELFRYDPNDLCTLRPLIRTPVVVHYINGVPPRSVLRRRAALQNESEPRSGGVVWGSDGYARFTVAKPPGTG